MRQYIKPLLGAAFFIISIALMASMSCSWEVFTKGEVNKDAVEILEESMVPSARVIEILSRIPGTELRGDSVEFKVRSTILYQEEWLEFVEMEVGELEIGEGEAPDTLYVDHRP